MLVHKDRGQWEEFGPAFYTAHLELFLGNGCLGKLQWEMAGKEKPVLDSIIYFQIIYTFKYFLKLLYFIRNLYSRSGSTVLYPFKLFLNADRVSEFKCMFININRTKYEGSSFKNA